MILINKSIDVLYMSQEKYSNIGDMHVCSQTCLPCDRVATSLACFYLLFVCFVVVVVFFLYVCRMMKLVNHDQCSS